MFTKEVDPFIDLRKKPEDPGTIPAMPEEKKEEPKGPCLNIYNSSTALPISDDDLDKSFAAEIKIKPHMIKKTVENGKTKYSYEIEVTAIRITS